MHYCQIVKRTDQNYMHQLQLLRRIMDFFLKCEVTHESQLSNEAQKLISLLIMDSSFFLVNAAQYSSFHLVPARPFLVYGA